MKYIFNRRFILVVFFPVVLFILMFSLDSFGLNPEYVVSLKVVCSTLWLTLWWATGIVPLAVTSFLPLILFPLFSILSTKEVFSAYSNPIIFLFLGGFFYAIALQKSGLHKRIALGLMLLIGKSSKLLVLGIMIATAITSMFMSNTVTAMMMFPLGMGLCELLEKGIAKENMQKTISNFKIILMLSIAYSASIGGMGTIIGSPPNAIAVGILESTKGISITFLEWAMVGVPLAICFVFLTWLLLFIVYPVGVIDMNLVSKYLVEEKGNLGAMKRNEKILIYMGAFLLLGWIGNDFTFIPILSKLSDTQVVLIAVIVLFCISIKGKPILESKDFSKIEWNILYMFGAGFALSAAYTILPLEEVVSSSLALLGEVHPLVMMITFCLMGAFITEFTSNSSVAVLLLPIIFVLSPLFGLNPLYSVLAVCFAASCAFMFPASTPSNAIVFGSGYITVLDLLKVGVILTILGGVFLGIYGYFIIPLFGI